MNNTLYMTYLFKKISNKTDRQTDIKIQKLIFFFGTEGVVSITDYKNIIV